jgi:beta-glucanase (GH16 family)
VVGKDSESWGFGPFNLSVSSRHRGKTLERSLSSFLILRPMSQTQKRGFGKIGVKQGFLAFPLILGCVLYGCQSQASGRVSSESDSKHDWVLTWNDEFNGPNGSSPDAAKWVLESGGNGWGNGELEYYTPRPKNLRLENGNLVIEAVKEEFTGSDGVKRRYTSGRLKTQGRFSQTYGRFEARIKIPSGQGVWPAMWLLGDDFSIAGWPACGEIDIMENVDMEKSMIHGTLHGPGYSAKKSVTSGYTLPQGRFADDFHIFAIDWEPEVIRFYVDDFLYATRTPADLPKGARWVYDHPFFVILNLAVGGSLPASPDASLDFPQRMLVDYVRVYSRR